MTGLSLSDWMGLLLLSAGASLVGLWLAGLNHARKSGRRGEARVAPVSASTFLFQDDTLIDLDNVDTPWEAHLFEDMTSWHDLRHWLTPRFGALPETLSTAGAAQQFITTDAGPKGQLCIEPNGAYRRVILTQEPAPSPVAWHATAAQAQNNASARAILETAPYPIWKTGADDVVLWQNAACAGLLNEEGRLPTPKADTRAQSRISVPRQDQDGPGWYEVHGQQSGEGWLYYATEITPVIRAETAQREFVQTLAKTFANLTTGLAIFDRNRQLALFNPALVDLTGVPVTFLSARPGLMQFFDTLRERQVLPEPKNYANWRAQISNAIERANEGFYQETWTLPTGLTYRVTGRPHPDGAVAFLFEDISAEISLTRRFRAQVDLGHSVLDGLDDAIAAIAPNNVVVFCNKACTELLKIDPDVSFADMSLRDLLAACGARFDRDANWPSFEARAMSVDSQDGSGTTLTTTTGARFCCSVSPLPGGMKMLRASAISETAPASVAQAAG